MTTAQPTRRDATRDLIALIRDNSRRFHTHEVFRDFCALSALSISNSVDRSQFDVREAEYLRIVKRYSSEEANRFAHMLGCVVLALEERMQDCLGSCFMSLDLGGHWAGQFFTPYEISKMMALMTCVDADSFNASGKRFITVMEPASGAGAMVIATADSLKERGLNYQQMMHATAIDLDLTAAHMSYIQFSLLHIPAVVLHGNSLSNKMYSHWVTPAHVLGLWDHRLKREHREDSDPTLLMPAADAAPAADTATILVAEREKIVTSRATQMALF